MLARKIARSVTVLLFSLVFAFLLGGTKEACRIDRVIVDPPSRSINKGDDTHLVLSRVIIESFDRNHERPKDQEGQRCE